MTFTTQGCHETGPGVTAPAHRCAYVCHSDHVSSSHFTVPQLSSVKWASVTVPVPEAIGAAVAWATSAHPLLTLSWGTEFLGAYLGGSKLGSVQTCSSSSSSIPIAWVMQVGRAFLPHLPTLQMAPRAIWQLLWGSSDSHTACIKTLSPDVNARPGKHS